jgi:hypothetical protein
MIHENHPSRQKMLEQDVERSQIYWAKQNLISDVKHPHILNTEHLETKKNNSLLSH